MNVTQKFIAQKTGVSQAVVSRVLSSRAREIGIAKSTIKRVLTMATDLGYMPNPGVNMMQGRQTKLLGVIVRSFEDPFLGIILDELNRLTREAKLTLLIKGFTDGVYDDGEIQSLLSYAPDSLILVGTMDLQTWNPSVFKYGKKIVQIGSLSESPYVSSCSLDEEEAARQIAGHLLDLGHKNCAIISNASVPTKIRSTLLKTTFKRYGIESKPEWQNFTNDNYYAAGQQAAQIFWERFGRNLPFSAAVATGDIIAMGFIQAIEKQNLCVPRDISICSYSNLDFASFTKPTLTSVDHSIRVMVRNAIRMASGEEKAKALRFKPKLMIRDSSAAYQKSRKNL